MTDTAGRTVFENRNILSGKDEVMSDWRKLRNVERHNLHS
jgi:hypothetical protein